MCPKPRREEAWRRLAADLDLAKLAAMRIDATLDDAPRLGADIVEGKVRGRAVLKIAP
jgi:acrylyl-CoA reductase (NADPH)